MQKHKEWLFIADKDMKAARVLLQEAMFEAAVYFLQQASEKALKAYLVFQKQELVKTHDLVFLLRQCTNINKNFSILHDAALIVKPYATQTRYPDDYEPVNEDEAQLALINAQMIMAFVLKEINAVGMSV